MLTLNVYVLGHFTENIGQVKNINGETNQEVYFSCYHNGLYITLREDGFSYETKEALFEMNEYRRLVNSTSDLELAININRIDFLFSHKPDRIIKKKESEGRKKFILENGKIVEPSTFGEIYYFYDELDFIIRFISNEKGFKYDLIFNSEKYYEHFFLQVNGDHIQGMNEKGNFQFTLGNRVFEEKIPYSFYTSFGRCYRQPAEISFVFDNHLMRLSLEGEYEPELGMLVVDPQPEMLWSTYFGGNEFDVTTRIAADSSNHVYQIGVTMSLDNIATSGAFQQTYAGDLDIYLSRFSPNGTLLWSTYFGGPQSERAYGIATTTNNQVIVGGSTFSQTGISTTGAYQQFLEGLDDGFLVSFDEDGNRLWGTYYGGNAHDFITSTTVNSSGKIIVGGHTRSTNNIATSGAFIETMTSTESGFISCFDANGFLEWGSYIGSASMTSVESVHVDDAFVYIAGRTNSPSGISTIGAHQENIQGATGFSDAFVSKFTLSGAIVWSSYYGGNFGDSGQGITTDEDGNVYLNGNASSLNNIATPEAHLPNRPSSESGFLAKLSPTGERIWATYIGDTGSDYLSVLAYSNGELINGGYTTSTSNIATSGAYQESNAGEFDGFLYAIDTAGNYSWGTFFGGMLSEELNGLAIDQARVISISGNTNSSDNITNEPAHQSEFGGGAFDGWIARICTYSQPTLTPDGNTLISSPSDNYTWFLDGVQLADTTQTIELTADGAYTVVTSSFGKCESQSEEYTHNTAAIETIIIESSIVVYPNPSNDFLYVTSLEKIISSIELINLNGKTVSRMDFINDTQTIISVNGLNAGLYVLRILLTDGGHYNTKILIN